MMLWIQKDKKADKGRIKAKKCNLLQSNFLLQNASNVICSE